jgi:thymidylate synthase (FAD)
MTTIKTDVSVKLIQQVGNDEMFVRAARRSTGNKDNVDGTDGLINYLIKQRHGSPFEHGSMTIEVECPIFVAREWMRHRIGWSYSELSGRYSTLETTFWHPSTERGIVNAGKPARPRMVDGTHDQYAVLSTKMAEAYLQAADSYMDMIDAGIAPEVARAILPVGTYTNFWATANPRSIMHFLSLRVNSPDSTFPTYPMQEIQDAADELEWYFHQYWPITHKAFVENGRVAP